MASKANAYSRLLAEAKEGLMEFQQMIAENAAMWQSGDIRVHVSSDR